MEARKKRTYLIAEMEKANAELRHGPVDPLPAQRWLDGSIPQAPARSVAERSSFGATSLHTLLLHREL
jgi:hypothetical protein